MRVLTVLGARPQFIKASPVSEALAAAGCREILVHTGQHYDRLMSDVFFEELGVPDPAHELGVGSDTHAAQTAAMLRGLEPIMDAERPDWVLVYGDTNSTLAGALAACKLRLPLAHVEAGLRSFNRAMPEEHNRVLTDHASDLLFCPTPAAADNLGREGLGDRAREVGDTMCDLLRRTEAWLEGRSTVVDRLALTPGGYVLATVHRAYNTDDPARLHALFAALAALDDLVVLPLHPRTKARLERFGTLAELGGPPLNLRLIDPIGYTDMIALERSARLILTDSGGIQKEAFLLSVPCITLRPETEWVETIESGWNRIADVDRRAILAAAASTDWPAPPSPPLYGDGRAAGRIVELLGSGRG